MSKHIKYFKYLLRHKWFVFIACRKCGVSLFRAIIHDWHKFLPSEWFPYANFFYGKHFAWSEVHGDARNHLNYSDSKEYWEGRFNIAWNLHQKRARHHWQFWLLTNDNSEPKHEPLYMPEKYVREMVADWWGAGKAITGNWDVRIWYDKNRDNILINGTTRNEVEALIDISEKEFQTPELIAKRIRIIGH